MKKIMTIVALAMTLPVAAQETYENAKIAQEDLNGTARYVGMGGAMDALGADISTISSNPAGIGLFRRSSISTSFGIVSQEGASSTMGGNKTNASFDQIGFVFSSRTGKSSYLNLAFNYHKSRNFNMILSAASSLENASLNKLTFDKALVTAYSHATGGGGLLYEQVLGEPVIDLDGNASYVPDFNRPYITCNQLDDILAPNYNYDPLSGWDYQNADAYRFDRAHKGYIGEYDFNISGNINNRVYLGLTVGLHDVHYKHYSEYTERLPFIDLTVSDSREITGTGFDVKAGIIIRPFEESPFRAGFSVSTPTFYELRTSNYTYITDGFKANSSRENVDANARSNFKFKLYTPWKFGLSLGHTIGTSLALGAGYEYADYGSLDTRNITDEYYDSWDNIYYKRSQSDTQMNDHTQRTLKGVHTLKLGAEFKPAKDVALRVGYNYVSPVYKKDGFKDGTLNSDASYVSSATDYTNWEATHRLTLGAGYTYQKFNISLAYQYSATDGTFYPFMSYDDAYDDEWDNIADGVKVSNKRHQLLMTLGYTF